MSWPGVVFESLYAEPSRNGIYKKKEFHGSGVKIVNMGELFGYEFIGPQNMKRLQMTDAELEKAGLEEGDLLFGRRSLVEEGAGKCSLIEGLYEPVTFESSIIRVRLNKRDALPKFYYYWFRSYLGRGVIKAIVTGTNVKGIKGSDLKQVQVVYPTIDEQKRIVDVIREYDKLIEINRRRIQLLEESARLLYKEWFVHLRFPGHKHTKIIDGVPDGWERKPLGDLCFQYKKTIKPNEVSFDTPYIGLEHIPRRSITISRWETSEKVTSNKYLFQERDILLGKIRPYLHKVGFALCDGITSSDAVVIRAIEKKLYHYILAYVSSDAFVELASKTCREGSKMPRADWNFLEKQLTIVPSKRHLIKFSEQQETTLKQLKALALYNKKLVEARDLLLPRLMNGDIEV
jgi:type I restriction enzyme S subunit